MIENPLQSRAGHSPATGTAAEYNGGNPAMLAEDIARAIVACSSPRMLTAKAEATLIWLHAKGRPPASDFERQRLAQDMDKFAFWSALIATNSDPHHPRVLQFGWPAHRRFGMDIPGTNLIVDNQDNAYYHIPIDGTSRYEISGRLVGTGPSNFSFQFTRPLGEGAFATLDGGDIDIAADGSFTITLDNEPANGRRNHAQSTPGDASYLRIRESLGDWAVENPHRYTVRRVGGPAAAEALSNSAEALSERSASLLMEFAARHRRVMKYFETVPINSFTPMVDSAAIHGNGALPGQASTTGHFRLAEDEAIVVTLRHGAATYFDIQALDAYTFSLDAHLRTSQLNHAQSQASPDGSYTYVLTLKDPGVHNWLDPVGASEGFVWVRLQGMPKGAEPPSIDYKLVKMKDLDAALPADIKRVSPEERNLQQGLREPGYMRRFTSP